MHALDESWDAIKREFTDACSQAARAARSQITNELNQSFRRLRNYQSEAEWLSALLDGAARLVHQAAVLELKDGVLTVRGQHNLKVRENFSFSVAIAPAFASAIESRDPIIALRTPGEVTEQLSGPDVNERAHIFPIANGSRVVAVLFAADQDYLDLNGLELLAGLASAVLERRGNSNLHSQIATAAPSERKRVREPAPEISHEPVTIESPSRPAPPTTARLPSWTDLSEEQRNLHIKAQRFSRVALAEMELTRPEACRAGREQGNLYVYLKNDIDKAREKFRLQFMTIPSMVDYLHLELVRAAEGDELKLGADYPGQLV